MTFEKPLTANPDVSGVSGDAVGETPSNPANGLGVGGGTPEHAVALKSPEYVVTRHIEDRPLRGMWHCGPNAVWVEVTHLPTMISARAFDQNGHHAKQTALTCCQLMVEQSRLLKCQFPERVTPEQSS